MPRTLALPTMAVFAGLLPAQTPVTPTTPPIQDKTQVDWKDLTRSGIPIKFYGFFRMDAYYNTARMDSVVIPTRVLAENGVTAKTNDDQFMMDPRLTRFGIDLVPREVGEAKVSAKLEIDFANFPTGSAESRATPRIRLAYIDLAKDDFGLRVGQDWDVISPLMPAVNSETLMWNAGNLGDRRAQIQGRWAPKDCSVDLKVALGLTGAVNNQDLDVPVGERDGFDSGMPHVQARLGWKPAGMVEKKPFELGVWGMFGRTETDTAFNGQTRFDTWTGGIDFTLPLCANFTMRGEAWTGENLGDMRGCIGQTINTTLGREIGSTGGWAEGVYQATDKTRLHAGWTIDDPDNADLAAGNPRKNMAGYVGTVMTWDTGLKTGFDAIYWETDYVGLGLGNALRFNLWFQLDW